MMRQIENYIVKFLVIIAAFQGISSGYLIPLDLRSDYNIEIRCFGLPREQFEGSSQREIIVNCNNLAVPCYNNTAYILNWLTEFYPDVTSLHLEENCITKVSVLPNLPGLTFLKLKYNKINNIEDGAFRFLPNLETLDLSHNLLTEIRPQIFERPQNNSSEVEEILLKSLHLGYNKIERISSLVFRQLPYLEELHLDGNPLHIIDHTTEMAIQWISRRSLKVLNLAKTELSSFPPSFFSGSKVKSLYINGNYFTQVPVELIHLRATLEFLNINENPISVLNSDSFFDLKYLKEIVASDLLNLTDVYSGTFLRLTSLEQLTLSYNKKLSFIDPSAFCVGPCRSHSSIRIVHLNNNNLHYLSEGLLLWDQLEKLTLSGNPWKESTKNWMRKLRYKCDYRGWDDFSDLCTSAEWMSETDCSEGQYLKNRCSPKHSPESKENIYRLIRDPISIIFILGFVILISSLVFLVIIKYTGKENILLSRKQIPVSDVSTLSSSVPYNKLDNKSSNEI